MIRKAVVSGQFYPQEKKQLVGIIEKYATPPSTKIDALGIILPHAGYRYSGKVAVTTAAAVLPKKRIVMLGPNHTGLGRQCGLWEKGSWITPLGAIPIDDELAAAILEEGDCIQPDHLCHESEHSLEVELPILHYFFSDFRFVPIACKMTDVATYREAALQILRGIRKIKDEILFVASTDLTHYEPEASARRKDRFAIDAIVNLDAEALLKHIRNENISMCGAAPVAIFLFCLKQCGATKAQVALYQTSAEASGDASSVVGYVGMIVS